MKMGKHNFLEGNEAQNVHTKISESSDTYCDLKPYGPKRVSSDIHSLKFVVTTCIFRKLCNKIFS